MKFKRWLRQTFTGCYGFDELFWALAIAYFLTYLIASVLRVTALHWVTKILLVLPCFLLSYGFLAIAMMRVLSKNIVKRRYENEKWKDTIRPLRDFFLLQRNKWRDRKTHVYRKCPDRSCKAVIRLPKKPGLHTVRCPKCQKTFQTKI